VAYVMLDLKRRNPDIRAYVCALESWIMKALATFSVRAERRAGRVGLWVDMAPYGGFPGVEAKIAAIGVRVRRWVTYHGAAINLNPDLSHYSGIVPCGIAEHGVTSLAALGVAAGMDDLDRALIAAWPEAFGPEAFGPAAGRRIGSSPCGSPSSHASRNPRRSNEGRGRCIGFCRPPPRRSVCLS
jgi:lipoyl(octanoyl) transferase